MRRALLIVGCLWLTACGAETSVDAADRLPAPAIASTLDSQAVTVEVEPVISPILSQGGTQPQDVARTYLELKLYAWSNPAWNKDEYTLGLVAVGDAGVQVLQGITDLYRSKNRIEDLDGVQLTIVGIQTPSTSMAEGRLVEGATSRVFACFDDNAKLVNKLDEVLDETKTTRGVRFDLVVVDATWKVSRADYFDATAESRCS